MNPAFRRFTAFAALSSFLLPLSARTARAAYDYSGVETWLKRQTLPNASIYRSYQTTPVDPRFKDDAIYVNALANTYDNALIGLYSLYNGAPGGAGRAKAILTYYSQNPNHDPLGRVFKSNIEFVISTGELMWMGMLAAQYDEKTGDHQFDVLMRGFDAYVLDPAMKVKGGVKAGPDFSSVSTENNIDVIAYLQMRYQILLSRDGPGDAAQAARLRARELEVAQWLVNEAYIASEGRLLRDANSTIFASDAHFWAIDMLTQLKKWDPAFYASSGLAVIDRKKLMRYAESHTQATVPYLKPDGTTVSFTGFRYTDQTQFAGEANAPVSMEWTAMAARAYDALGETANAAAVRANLQKVKISGPNGSESWAYASVPGMTFSDGWYAGAYPAVSSTIWSTIALSGFPSQWPFSFGEVVSTAPGPPLQKPLPRPRPLPKPPPRPGPGPVSYESRRIVGPRAPRDNYVPLTTPAGRERAQASFPMGGQLAPDLLDDASRSPHDVHLPAGRSQ